MPLRKINQLIANMCISTAYALIGIMMNGWLRIHNEISIANVELSVVLQKA
jgi:hypothetical protein